MVLSSNPLAGMGLFVWSLLFSLRTLASSHMPMYVGLTGKLPIGVRGGGGGDYMNLNILAMGHINLNDSL